MRAAHCLLFLYAAVLLSACDPKPDSPAQPGIPPQAESPPSPAASDVDDRR